MIEWAGWKLDEVREELLLPVRTLVRGMGAAILVPLLRAEGRTVSLDELGEAVSRITTMRDCRQAARTAVNTVRIASCRHAYVVCDKGVGYRLRPLDGREEAHDGASEARRRRIEKILIDELEATGPHARAVARLLEEVW